MAGVDHDPIAIFWNGRGGPRGRQGVRDGANRGEVCQAVARPVRSPFSHVVESPGWVSRQRPFPIDPVPSPVDASPLDSDPHQGGTPPRAGLRQCAVYRCGFPSPHLVQPDDGESAIPLESRSTPGFRGHHLPPEKRPRAGHCDSYAAAKRLGPSSPKPPVHSPLGRAWQPRDQDTATRLQAARPFGVKAPQPSLRTGRACGDAGSASDYEHG
jgi:hypothetical protein